VSRRYLRPGVLGGHLLVLIAALVCLRLGWWQWNVAHETRGTIQNLGYALLWPVFGGAFIFMWLRFLYLEDGRRGRQADPDGLPESAGEADPAAAAAWVSGAGPIGPAESDPSATPAADRESPAGREPGDDPEAGADPVQQPHPDAREAELDGDGGARPGRTRRPPAPSTAVTIAVATVGGDDEDDPELAAYNEALARLAEQDRRRAR
jgi:hypothetical protein